ncbi:MAG: pre-peptidase C-terminal domain-containing protein, partial [Chloroflexota bacterium]
MRHWRIPLGIVLMLAFVVIVAAQSDGEDGDDAGDRLAIIQTATAFAEQNADAEPTPAPAIDDTSTESIAFNETITASIAERGQMGMFTLTLVGGETYTIEVNSDEFDPTIQLLDAFDEIVAADDDGGEGTNSRISDFTPLSSGDYTLVVSSFANVGVGAYTVLVSDGAATGSGTASEAPATDGDGIVVGGTVSGELTATQRTLDYPLEVEAGAVYTFSLTSDDFDTTLEILNSDGTSLVFDDDGGDATNSTIEAFAFPAGGVYTVRVSSFASAGAGAFALQVDDVSTGGTGSGTGDVVVAGDGDTIAVGTPVTGQVTPDEPSVDYVLTVEMGA